MANSTNKITKVQVIDMMLADENINCNATYVSYLENEKALLVKKAEKKKAKTNSADEELMNAIFDTLSEAGCGLTVSEIQSRNAVLSPTLYSNQKITALVKKMKENGIVSKSIEKGKSYFKAC